MAKAYMGSGNQAKAKEMFRKASNHNQLPTFNQAFVTGEGKQGDNCCA